MVDLCSPITKIEIQKVLFSMNNGKALGPDGYFMEFFKSAWVVVGDDFCAAISHYFLLLLSLLGLMLLL